MEEEYSAQGTRESSWVNTVWDGAVLPPQAQEAAPHLHELGCPGPLVLPQASGPEATRVQICGPKVD